MPTAHLPRRNRVIRKANSQVSMGRIRGRNDSSAGMLYRLFSESGSCVSSRKIYIYVCVFELILMSKLEIETGHRYTTKMLLKVNSRALRFTARVDKFTSSRSVFSFC